MLEWNGYAIEYQLDVNGDARIGYHGNNEKMYIKFSDFRGSGAPNLYSGEWGEQLEQIVEDNLTFLMDIKLQGSFFTLMTYQMTLLLMRALS